MLLTPRKWIYAVTISVSAILVLLIHAARAETETATEIETETETETETVMMTDVKTDAKTGAKTGAKEIRCLHVSAVKQTVSDSNPLSVLCRFGQRKTPHKSGDT